MWSVGQIFASIGLVSALALAGFAASRHTDSPAWLETAAFASTVLLLIGALILWMYSLRFYCRIQRNLGVMRSAIYLAFLIGLSWLSPVAFMILEGKERFFELALD